MLLLGSANTLTLGGISVYPDDSDPLQYWYLPGPVQLARRPDRRPQLTLIEYVGQAARTDDDGGFLMFEVNLRLDPDTERQLRSRLRAIAGGAVRLSPAQFDEGTVKCVALDLEGAGGTINTDGSFKVVERINGATTPSLAGDNNAIFTLKLSKEGAAIVHDTLMQGGQPVGVIYDLTYTGLRPALEVKITADMSRVFNQFSASLEAQIYYVRAGIDAGFEKLVQDGAIKIEVKNFSTAEDRGEKEKWALDFFKENLLAKWFEPTLTPGVLSGTPADADPLADVVALGQKLRPPQPPEPAKPAEGPARPTEPPQTAPKAGDPDHDTGSKPQPGLRPLPETPTAPDQPPTVGTGVAGASPTVPPVSAAPLRFDPAPVANRAGDVAGNISPVSFKLKFVRQEERKTLTLEYNRAEAVQMPYNPQGFLGVLLQDIDRGGLITLVDLDHAFFREFDVEVTKRIDFAQIGLNSVQITLDYGDPSIPDQHKHTDLLFARDEPSPTVKSWHVPMALTQSSQYKRQVEYNFDPQSEWEGGAFEVDLSPELPEDRRYEINPYEHFNFLQVEVRPDVMLDWGLVDSIDVFLTLEGGSGAAAHKQMRFQNGEPGRRWLVRAPVQRDEAGDRITQRYEYRLVYHLHGGATQEVASPAPISSEALILANPLPGTLALEVRPVLNSSTKFAILDVDYLDGNYNRRLSLEFAAGVAEQAKVHHLAIPDPTKRSFSYAITVIGTDNSVTQQPSVVTDNPRIFVG